MSVEVVVTPEELDSLRSWLKTLAASSDAEARGNSDIPGADAADCLADYLEEEKVGCYASLRRGPRAP